MGFGEGVIYAAGLVCTALFGTVIPGVIFAMVTKQVELSVAVGAVMGAGFWVWITWRGAMEVEREYEMREARGRKHAATSVVNYGEGVASGLRTLAAHSIPAPQRCMQCGGEELCGCGPFGLRFVDERDEPPREGSALTLPPENYGPQPDAFGRIGRAVKG